MLISGTVYLVGAGPGDPGLLTVRGRRCIEGADVIIYDRLVDERMLRLAKPGAQLICVDDLTGRGSPGHGDVNARLVAEARAGRVVVRLHDSDPFVFGRGGAEAEVLAAAGVPFVIVPGVAAAVAVPAYAGIPVTHRDCASSFAVVADAREGSPIEWDKLAGSAGTLVFLMETANLPFVIEQLVQHGRAAATPVALVHCGTRPNQSTLVGTLADIVEKAADFRPPAIVVVGEVVRLGDRLRWFDNRPLFGRRVLVTRSHSQASVLSALLEERGAQVLELPTIQVVPPKDFRPAERALDSLADYDWVVFTSANGVERVMDYLALRGKDARAFGHSLLAAIGPATAIALADRGLHADYVPAEYVAEALAVGLGERGIGGKRVLLARAAGARAVLAQDLRQLGADVTDVAVYDTIMPTAGDGKVKSLLHEGLVDAITFTSSSTVRNFCAMFCDTDLGAALSSATVGCIGPITAQTARDLGLRVDVVATEYTIPGLVRSLEGYFGDRNRRQ